MSELGKVSEQRRRFLKAVYDLSRDRPTRPIYKADVAQRLGLDVTNRARFDEFMAIAQYFSDLGYVRTFEGSTNEYREYGFFRITEQGIEAAEEEF